MRKLAIAACLLVLTACGLPLSDGIQKPGPVPAEQRQGGDIQVLPPAPRDDAPPDQVVRDFFGAQSSPGDAHASAREFLAPELRKKWRDDGPVSVLGSGLDVARVPGEDNAFRVTASFVGQIAPDGAYLPTAGRVDQIVKGRRGSRGRWQITDVPNGLLLTRADRERSFRARNLYFIAPAAAPDAEPSHFVPDQVFMPVTAGSADALVRRLLAGPSRGLADSVETAFPAGTKVRSVRTEASGLVTVDLTQQVRQASAELRQQMAAQLVWTLKALQDFSELRLLSQGQPLGDDGQELLRDRSDGQEYDPDGLVARAPLYFIGGRRLRQLEPAVGPTSAASSRRVVDAAAVSPRGGTLALVTQVRGGAELTTGPPSGPFVLRARARSLSYPTWGSGERGVFFLQNGRLRLAPLAGGLVDVPVDGIGAYGPISAVRVSRDGARVGIIAGVGTGRRLLVGRVVDRNGGPRVAALLSVAPGVRDVGDLSWSSATSLVVLGQASGVTGPVRIAVDGSSVALVNRVGLERTTLLSIAAAPGHPEVVGAMSLDAKVPALFRDNGGQYVAERGVIGERPFYPG